MGHLNAESYARLMKRPQDEAELYAHLSEGCDACEAFLASQPDPLLDGVTDAALLSSARAPDIDPRAEATYQRIRPRPSSSTRRWVMALAAMLLAFVAAALLVSRPREAGDGLKGAPVLTLELQAVVKAPDGALTRVVRGATVPGSGTLLIRYHASDAATAKLVVIRDGKREVLGPVQLEGGTHDLTRDGALLGLGLDGERGRLTVRLEAVSSAAELEVNVGP